MGNKFTKLFIFNQAFHLLRHLHHLPQAQLLSFQQTTRDFVEALDKGFLVAILLVQHEDSKQVHRLGQRFEEQLRHLVDELVFLLCEALGYSLDLFILWKRRTHCQQQELVEAFVIGFGYFFHLLLIDLVFCPEHLGTPNFLYFFSQFLFPPYLHEASAILFLSLQNVQPSLQVSGILADVVQLSDGLSQFLSLLLQLAFSVLDFQFLGSLVAVQLLQSGFQLDLLFPIVETGPFGLDEFDLRQLNGVLQ